MVDRVLTVSRFRVVLVDLRYLMRVRIVLVVIVLCRSIVLALWWWL